MSAMKKLDDDLEEAPRTAPLVWLRPFPLPKSLAGMPRDDEDDDDIGDLVAAECLSVEGSGVIAEVGASFETV